MGRHYTEQSLKEVIAEMLKAGGMERRYNQLEIEKCFRDVVGAFISKHINEVRVFEKKILLRCNSGPLRQELSYSKSQLIKLLNDRLGAEAITEIEVR